MKSDIKIKGKKFYSNFRGLDQKSKEWAIGLNVAGHPALPPKAAETAASIIAGTWKEVLRGLITRKQAEGKINGIANLPPIVRIKALDRVKQLAVADGFGNMPSIRQYLNEFEGSGVPKTRQQRQTTFRLFIAFLGSLADRRLDSLVNNECVKFCKARLESVCRSSTKRECDYLKAAFSKARKDKIIDDNPFEGIDFVALNKEVNPELGEDSQPREPFSMEEMKILCSTITAPWRDMAFISFLTGGQRLGDIACLKWEQVDFAEKSVVFYTSKTSAKLRVVMNPVLEARLLSLYKARLDDDIYVFPDERHTYEVKDQGGVLSNEFSSIVKALGFPVKRKKGDLKGNRRYIYPKTFHSIRHSVVSVLRSSGVVSPDVAREIVGHASEEIERQYFTALNSDLQRGYSHLVTSLGIES